MPASGQEDSLPRPSLSGRCPLGEPTFAGIGGKEEDAPKAALAVMLVPRAEIDPKPSLDRLRSGLFTRSVGWPRDPPTARPAVKEPDAGVLIHQEFALAAVQQAAE